MSSRIKFFRDGRQAEETKQFLNGHGLKSYTRERSQKTVRSGEVPFGVDLYILRDEDIEEAKTVLDYEYGGEWGEGVA